MIAGKLKTVGAFAAGVLVASAFLNTAATAGVDFSGKQITALIPTGPGGGTDKITRLFIPFFKKYLPGNPTIIARNMPGGSGIRGNNWFESNAKPDGLTWVAVGAWTQTTFLLGGEKVRYKMKDWEYILATPRGTVIYARPETGVKGKNIRNDIITLRNTQLVAGSKNPTSAELRNFLAYELLGIKNVKAVFGISGGGQRKAFLRGELNINADSGGAYLKSVTKYVKKGEAIPVMTLGYTDPNGNIVRDPGFPNLPTVIDAYKAVHGGKMPSGNLWQAYKNLYSMSVMTSKGFALPSNTPQAIVDAYVEAAKKASKDKKFMKIAEKELGNYPILFGQDAKKAFSDAIDVSPEVEAHLKEFIKKKFGSNT